MTTSQIEVLKALRNIGIKCASFDCDGNLSHIEFSEHSQIVAATEQPLHDDIEDFEKAKNMKVQEAREKAESLLYGGPLSRMGQ